MSLGLVAYDDSEESENESDSNENPPLRLNISQNKVVPAPTKATEPTKIERTPVKELAGHISDDELELTTNSVKGSANIRDEKIDPIEIDSEKSGNLHFPESKLSLINTDIDIKCLTNATKKNGPVKITIPSLVEVSDEADPPSKKKLKPSQKGSGLFALLPTPKSTLVPHSVANRRTLPPAAKRLAPAPSFVKKPVQAKRTATKASSLINYEDSGDEDESLGTVDFFSLTSEDKALTPAADVNIDIPDIPSSIKNEVEGAGSSGLAGSSSWQHTTQSKAWEEVVTGQQASYSGQAADTQSSFGYATSEFMTVSSNDLELDQQAMQQLCGRRDRLKMQEVNLIDVSGDAIMPDSREWLTKQLTEEVAHRPSHKRKDGPTTQQKRKHQITYLAYQAKENELELKNQWANNRMSRKQTQAKYGF